MGLGFIQVPTKVIIGLIIFYNRKTNYFKRSSYATDSFLFFPDLVHSLRHLILELYEGCIVYIWKVLQIFKEKKHENSLLIAAPSNKYPLKNKLYLINSHGFHCPQWTSVRNLGHKIDGLLLASSSPLQYSCLENPRDRGTWWVAVHGVARSQTRLSDFTLFFHFHALEKAMATHSSVLAWRIPGKGKPVGLLSMGSQRVGHDWSDLAAAAAAAGHS